MWTLFEIWDFFVSPPDPVAKRMFKGEIDRYDSGFAQTKKVDLVTGQYLAWRHIRRDDRHELSYDPRLVAAGHHHGRADRFGACFRAEHC